MMQNVSATDPRSVSLDAEIRLSLLTRPGPLRSSDLAHLRGVVLPAHPQFIGFRRQAGTEPDDRAPGAKPTGT